MSTEQNTQLATTEPKSRPPAMTTFAETYGLNPGQVMSVLAKTVISIGREEGPPTAEEISACAIVCNMHSLNPFLKEIHFFRSKGRMLYVVGVDGWAKIAQRQPQMNGVEWTYERDDKGEVFAMSCKVYRKDWALPVVVTEFLSECRREKSEAWQKSPMRMLRNRSFAQAIRVAFAIGGIMDEEDADQITSGAFSSKVLEAESLVDETEQGIRAAAATLKLNSAKLQTLRTQYEGRPEELLSYLQAEVAKTGQVRVMPPSTRRAKPQQATHHAQQQVPPQGEEPQQESADGGFDFNYQQQAPQQEQQSGNVEDF